MRARGPSHLVLYWEANLTILACISFLKPESLPGIEEFARRGLGEGDLHKIEIIVSVCPAGAIVHRDFPVEEKDDG